VNVHNGGSARARGVLGRSHFVKTGSPTRNCRLPNIYSNCPPIRCGGERAVSLFSGLGLVPAYRAARVTAGAVSWDYTTVVNIVFLLLAAALLVLFFCSGGAPVLKVMVGSPDVHEHARGGVAAWRRRGRAHGGIGTGRRHGGPPAGEGVSLRGRCRARRAPPPSGGRGCRRGSPCAVRRRYGCSTRTGRAAGWRSPRCSRCRSARW